jgi:hypothetical protein
LATLWKIGVGMGRTIPKITKNFLRLLLLQEETAGMRASLSQNLICAPKHIMLQIKVVLQAA